jgi:hypothetical protein
MVVVSLLWSPPAVVRSSAIAPAGKEDEEEEMNE